MADDLYFKIENDNTGEVLRRLKKATEKILDEWGKKGEAFAKDEINKVVYDTDPSPTYKRTGRLRSSLTYATKEYQSPVGKEAGGGDGMQKKQASENSVVVGTNVEYAAYVEFGTSKMRPRPYLKPAIENHMDAYKKIMETYLTDVGKV